MNRIIESIKLSSRYRFQQNLIYRLIGLIRYTHKKIHTMPNWSHSRIVITLPPVPSGDVDDAFYATQAQRQTLWEIWRDLKYHLVEDGCHGYAEGRWVGAERRDGNDNLEPFNILRPRPADEEDNWYEWNSSHWGTKWDLSDVSFEIEGREITLTGNTAWGPPIALLDYLNEIGFEIYADHISLENQNWGYTEDGHTTAHQLYRDWFDEEDEEDDIATLLFDYESENGIMDDHHSLVNYIAWGDFDAENHIPLYLREYLDGYADDMFENYNYWKENCGKIIPDDDIKSLRHKVMEIIEEANDCGKINEGQYLTLCNEVRTISVDKLNDIIDTLSSDQVEHDEDFDMIYYYRQGGDEPLLIEVYG